MKPIAIVIAQSQSGTRWMVATIIGKSTSVMKYAVRHVDLAEQEAITTANNYNTAQPGAMPIPAIVPVDCPTPGRLSPKARELIQDQANGFPVWIRSPKIGVEFYTGFSRAKLYEGAGKGHFRSVSIREPGQVKGTRLFNLQSVLDYIAKSEQEAT